MTQKTAEKKSAKAPNAHLQAMQIARDGDTAARCSLAARNDTPPEILYFLADDPDADVRRRIAENSETPSKADLLLARDDCDDVRCVVATKIGQLFPEISETERKVMRRAVLDVLEVLAADQTERIRELVSNALKDAPDVPPHVVRQLAKDPLLSVCGPVLEYSPVLTDEDLLEIISSSPVQGALSAISRRASVADTVSHAIASSDDVEAITELLANPSAQIREETLDTLIERAPTITAWHGPLVKRPVLTTNAAQRIAGFVADSLLESLRARPDLGTATLDAVEAAVKERLEKEKKKSVSNRWLAEADDAPETAKEKKDDDAYARAAKMKKKGRLTEKAISEAAGSGDRKFVMAALSLRAEISRGAVARVFEMRSSKGVVALCWKAGLTMDMAIRLQMTVCSIAPHSVLRSENGRAYPMNEEEMNWRLEFFESEAGTA